MYLFVSVMPAAISLRISCTGLPGMSLGRKKFRSKAITKVKIYQISFLPRYFM